MERDVFDHTNFNSLYDLAKRTKAFMADRDACDEMITPENADAVIDFMVAVCRHVAAYHISIEADQKARECSKVRLDTMGSHEVAALAEEALVFDYRGDQDRLAEDINFIPGDEEASSE